MKKTLIEATAPLHLTPTGLAVRWHHHPESIRRKIRRREIASVKVGRRVLIPLADVEEMERQGRSARTF